MLTFQASYFSLAANRSWLINLIYFDLLIVPAAVATSCKPTIRPTTLALTTLVAQRELNGRSIGLVLEVVGQKFLHTPDNYYIVYMLTCRALNFSSLRSESQQNTTFDR